MTVGQLIEALKRVPDYRCCRLTVHGCQLWVRSDDAQITNLVVKKRYSDAPGIKVLLMDLTGELPT